MCQRPQGGLGAGWAEPMAPSGFPFPNNAKYSAANGFFFRGFLVSVGFTVTRIGNRALLDLPVYDSNRKEQLGKT